MNTSSRPKWPIQLIATAVVFVVAALVVPAAAGAKQYKAHGVRAEIKQGTLEVKGNQRANTVALRLKAGDQTRVEVDVGDDGYADFSFARREVSAIKVRMGGGRDSARIDDANGAFTDSIPTTIAGGRGNDSLNGGLGAETFKGGKGKDSVLGGKAHDTAYLGRGNDTFLWDTGDGSDLIEGQRGRDTMLFNGAAANEDVTMSANGGRLRFFRTPGNVTMDTDGVETVDFNALGGTDTVRIGDLTGTDVTRTNLDLAETLGGSAGDGVVDNVVVNGTNGADRIRIHGTGSGATVKAWRRPCRSSTQTRPTLSPSTPSRAPTTCS